MKRSNVIVCWPGASKPVAEEATEKQNSQVGRPRRQEKGGRTIFGHEKSEQVLGELEAELGQGALELSAIDGPRAIPVETPEYMLPVLVFDCEFISLSEVTQLYTPQYIARGQRTFGRGSRE